MKQNTIVRALTVILMGLFSGGCAMAAGAAAGALAGSVVNLVSSGVKTAVSGPQKTESTEDLATMNRQAAEMRKQQMERQRQLMDSQQDQSQQQAAQVKSADLKQYEEKLAIRTAQKRGTTIMMSGSDERTGTYQGQDESKCDIVKVERTGDSRSQESKAVSTKYIVCNGEIVSSKGETPSSSSLVGNKISPDAPQIDVSTVSSSTPASSPAEGTKQY